MSRARGEDQGFSPAVAVMVAAAGLPLAARAAGKRVGGRPGVGGRGGGGVSSDRTAGRGHRGRRGRLVLLRVGQGRLVVGRGRRRGVVGLVARGGGVVQLLAARQVRRLRQGELVLGVGDAGQRALGREGVLRDVLQQAGPVLLGQQRVALRLHVVPTPVRPLERVEEVDVPRG